MKTVQRELIHDGYTLRGLYTTPDGEFSKLVVMLHGFTGHKNENGYFFKYLSWELANNGIASLRFDFMGSGDSDGYFKDFTLDTLLSDASCIIDEGVILNHHKNIILLGFSMGGAIASRISLRKNSLIEKMILASPAGNMPLLLEAAYNTRTPNDNECVDMGGYYLSKKTVDSFQNYDFYKNLEEYTKQVLIIHGSKDAAVDLQYSRKFYESYKFATYEIIPNATHCYTAIEDRKKVYSLIIDFCK